MQINKILNADLLDILFEGKNKDYGAYELRKTYNNRLKSSLLIMAGMVLLIFLVSFITMNRDIENSMTKQNVEDLKLTDVKIEDPPPPPPKSTPPPRVATIKFPPPMIVRNIDVIEPPPENKDLEEKRVDLKTTGGKNDDGIEPPAEEKRTQVVEAPQKREDSADTVFQTVQIEASFPGGEGGWTRYVKKAIEQNIDELTESGASGACRIRFIVAKDGSVSDVEALTMKGTKLAEVAINAIRKGPKWIPAQQNGRFVNAFREQPVTFTFQDQ